MTEEERLDNRVEEMLWKAHNDLLLSMWEYNHIDREAIKDVFRNIGSSHKEERRLWKIRIYGHSYYNTYFSDIKELTESEAVKWYNDYNTVLLMKGDLLYKKEGEWVTYEIEEEK